jgi:hypothetical protein
MNSSRLLLKFYIHCCTSTGYTEFPSLFRTCPGRLKSNSLSSTAQQSMCVLVGVFSVISGLYHPNNTDLTLLCPPT